MTLSALRSVLISGTRTKITMILPYILTMTRNNLFYLGTRIENCTWCVQYSNFINNAIQSGVVVKINNY